MCYSVYAVLGANSSSWHGEIVSDGFTMFSVMKEELWTGKREMGEEDDNHGEVMSRYEYSRVRQG
jgi:hypothetical protein